MVNNNESHRGVDALQSDPAVSGSHPVTFRLPSKGGDPHFGFSASYYRLGEQRKHWRLVRIKEPGKMRGVTLVPYGAVAKFVREKMEAANAAAESQQTEAVA